MRRRKTPVAHLYHCGNPWAAPLKMLFEHQGWEVEDRDIRGPEGAEHRAFLIGRGLYSCPQAFTPSGEHLGDYAAAAAMLAPKEPT